jgi:uncharacterized short protein YbdD (DUF466 family)
MIKSLFGEIRDAYHGVFGVPDYDAYLRHMRERHPGVLPLGQKDFAARWIDRRYDGMRSRCC